MTQNISQPYLPEEEVNGFSLKENAPSTLRELFAQMDDLFRFFLNTKQGGELKPKIQKALAAKKLTLSSFIQGVFGPSIDLMLDKNFTPKSLQEALIYLAGFGGQMIQNKPEIVSLARSSKSLSSPLGYAGLDFFGENYAINTREMLDIESFFRTYLFNAFFQKNSELEMQEEASRVDSKIREKWSEYMQIFAWLCETQKIETLTKTQLFESLLMVATHYKKIDQCDIVWFLEECWMFLESPLENPDTSHPEAEIIPKIITLFKGKFPTYWIETVTKVNVWLILLGDSNDPGNSLLGILPPGNFVFDQEKDKEPDEADVFPQSWALFSDASDTIWRDSSIFDIHGKKVFWGDIRFQDIPSLRGTYFILAQNDSIGPNVPKFAIVAESMRPVRDLYGEALREEANMSASIISNDIPYLLPDYIRLRAIGKIQDGQYIRNPKTIKVTPE